MVTTFHLIRHAEKTGAANILSGRMPGIGLSPLGARQAEALGRRLINEPVRQIFCGPLERSKETAEAIARTKRLPVRVCDSFNEYDFGAWTGSTFLELEKESRWRDFNAHRSATTVPEGETMLDVQARVVGALMRLSHEMPGESMVIVSHAEPIRAALLYCLGMPLDSWGRLQISVASISTVAFGSHGLSVLRLNEPPAAC